MTVVFIGSEHIFEFHPLSWDTDTEQNGSIYLKTKGVWKSIKQPILPSVSQDWGGGGGGFKNVLWADKMYSFKKYINPKLKQN